MLWKNKNITIILVIFLIVTSISFYIPTGSYLADTNGSLIADSFEYTNLEHLSIFEIIRSFLDGFIGRLNGDISIFNEGPIVGTFWLSILLFSIGGYISIINKSKIFEDSISYLIATNKSIYKITFFISLFLTIGASIQGMYETTLGFSLVLCLLYNKYDIDNIFVCKLMLYSLSIGHIGSTLNPFLTGVASTYAGINILDGIWLRILLLIILFLFTQYVLYIDLRKYNIIEVNENKSSKFRYKYVMVFVPFILMTLMFSLNFSMLSVSLMFLACTLLFINKDNYIKTLLIGFKSMLNVVVIISLARSIYVILFNANVVDTIIFNIVNILSGSNYFIILIIVSLVFLVSSFLVPSTSALSALLIPILAPSFIFLGIEPKILVTLFGAMCGVLKVISITSPVVIGLNTLLNIDYLTWFKQSYKFALALYFISMTMIFIFG